MKKLKAKIKEWLFGDPLAIPTPEDKRRLQTIRIADIKPGDTIVVSLPRIEIMDQAESDKIEQSVRAELKMPEGVNVAVFFGQVEIFHLRKV